MARWSARCLPRVGLLGNPSDLYGGAGLGFTFDAFAAEVELGPRSAALSVEEALPLPLLRAAWSVLAPERAGAPPWRVRARSSIPRQAGLGGSSAIVIAALRAFAAAEGAALAPSRLAELAWRAEAELLGIRAGPLDRLVQAHEGLLHMDFAQPWRPSSVRRLDPGLLPPLRLLVDRAPGLDSGSVHEPVWRRWRACDPEVTAAMSAFRPLVAEGLAALLAGDRAAFRACADRNDALRARVFALAPRDLEAMSLARAHGAAAKLAGSGGAVLALLQDAADPAPLEAAARAAGYTVVEPRVAAAS